MNTYQQQESLWQRMRDRLSVPSWAISVIVHAVLFILLSLATTSKAPVGETDEPDRSMGIVLVKDNNGKKEYFDGSDENQNNSESQSDQSVEDGLNDGESPLDSAFDASSNLPNTSDIGPGPTGDNNNTQPGGVTKGGAPKRTAGGGAITDIFGVTGTGHRFVYVFDRSSSMEAAPMQAAKRELLASIESLDSVHQFQVIFYSHVNPMLFSPKGEKDRLYFADKDNKASLKRWVNNITAQGGTKPKPALSGALALGPDVIFFLTDGDRLDNGLLTSVSRLNRRGTSINVIQFGEGRISVKEGGTTTRAMMRAFVRKNKGQYIYKDINNFGKQ